MGRTRRGRLQTRQCHATPPPPSAFRSVAPSATGAPRARALQRQSPRVTAHQTGHAHGHGAFSPLASPACRPLALAATCARHGPAPARLPSPCVASRGSDSVSGGRAIRAPRRCREVFSGYSNDLSALRLELQLLVWPAKQFGFKVFARPESRPNPIAG